MAGELENAPQLVKQRRSIIEALAKGYQAGETENQIEGLLKIQSAIVARYAGGIRGRERRIGFED
jgi:hypothetical protein